MLLHVPNQKYKRLKIKNGQNDRSGNSSVNHTGISSLQHLIKQQKCWQTANKTIGIVFCHILIINQSNLWFTPGVCNLQS